jgi:hypothetical protein
VVASLNGSSITRLKKTWDVSSSAFIHFLLIRSDLSHRISLQALSSKAKLSIAALRDLFDASRNHANVSFE